MLDISYNSIVELLPHPAQHNSVIVVPLIFSTFTVTA